MKTIIFKNYSDILLFAKKYFCVYNSHNNSLDKTIFDVYNNRYEKVFSQKNSVDLYPFEEELLWIEEGNIKIFNDGNILNITKNINTIGIRNDIFFTDLKKINNKLYLIGNDVNNQNKYILAIIDVINNKLDNYIIANEIEFIWGDNIFIYNNNEYKIYDINLENILIKGKVENFNDIFCYGNLCSIIKYEDKKENKTKEIILNNPKYKIIDEVEPEINFKCEVSKFNNYLVYYDKAEKLILYDINSKIKTILSKNFKYYTNKNEYIFLDNKIVNTKKGNIITLPFEGEFIEIFDNKIFYFDSHRIIAFEENNVNNIITYDFECPIADIASYIYGNRLFFSIILNGKKSFEAAILEFKNKNDSRFELIYMHNKNIDIFPFIDKNEDVIIYVSKQ